MKRREFLSYCGLCLITSLLPWGVKGFAAGLLDSNAKHLSGRRKLIVLFQRGGVDSLNVVIPFTDSVYYDSRPTIAIPVPGNAQGALDLDGTFGLHPALNSLLPYWKDKSLAFIHACGAPGVKLSHVDAQAVIETGVMAPVAIQDGWLNRLVGLLPKTGVQQGIAIGSEDPRIFRGRAEIKRLSSPADVVSHSKPLLPQFEQLYQADKQLAEVYRDAVESRTKRLKELHEDEILAINGAPSPSRFASNCETLAKMLVQDPSMQVVFLDVAGWDTHTNQGNGSGLLASSLKGFGEGLSNLVNGLGESFKDTLIVTVSEFGRTLKENPLRGTDHGHGTVITVLGGNVTGGKIYTDWPGLGDLDELPITIDIRHVLSYLVGKHMQLVGTDVQLLFPTTPFITLRQQKMLENLLQ